MNRRQMVVLPGIALAASRGFSQTSQAAATSSVSGTVSHKALSHYTRLKSLSTIPKSAGKQAKYISFLAAHLSLSTGQQAEAADIFAAASTSVAQLKTTIKTTRKSLGESVKNNDSVGIDKTSLTIGKLVQQRHSISAKANAAFYQTLTADQQAKFSQLTSSAW
jgi:Spy/CpxP family protein refolding chaperone